MRTRALLVGCLCMVLAVDGRAQGEFIDLFPKTEAEVVLILDALDAGVSEHDPATPPVVMMLHGPQAANFLRSAYPAHQDLIDRTARLSAFGVLDVQICETWMRDNGYGREDLFPFISPVPYGVDELTRLTEEENYREWSLDI